MGTLWYLVKMFAAWAILATAIYTDISLEMGITENTRNAYYEGASGRTPP